MRRMSWALLAGALILLPGAGRAADEGPAGNWKMSLFLKGEMKLIGLLRLETADGKWNAKLVEARGIKVGDAAVADGMLRFTISINNTPFKFEGRLPKGDAKTITGNIAKRGDAIPAELERTSLTSLTPFDLEKDALAKATGFEVNGIAMNLLGGAKENKAKPEEVRSWAEKAYKAAEPYGPPVQADTTLEIASTLTEAGGYPDVALNYARRAERNLEPKSRLLLVKQTLEVLASALKQADKADEAKEVEGRIAKLNPEVKPAPFAGRKSKSKRAVLVELFTGAQCPPCVAADKAFDALEKTYQPGEVVLLEYHEHIPGPDPLTVPACEKRFEYYFAREEKSGTPSIVFDGASGPEAAGGLYHAIERYDGFVDALNDRLEQLAGATLQAKATRKGNKVEITAEATDVAKPGDGVRLRLVLVEETIDYKGGNGIPSYHHVVRDMPGGVTGIAVKEKTAKQSVTVDLDQLKKDLKKYLDNWAAENDKFPGKVPEIELKNLRVVAFVQDDKTKEVLQAVQVDVKNAE